MKLDLSKILGAAFLLGAAAASEACTVPVFRYALDHWPADAYRLEAPDGWLETPAGQAFQKRLTEAATPVEMRTAEEGAAARLLMPSGEDDVVWTGDLDRDAERLFVSPAREEVVNRILSGESMVWVMVSSGDAAKDEALENQMTTRLKYLESVAAIPEQDPNDPESRLGPGPELRAGFSFLRIDREDAEEKIFVQMLSGPGEGGEELRNGDSPYAAVVFGRGRVLGAWNATDLDDAGIDEVSLFLLGACSCRVKVQNPGWDLALAVDWDSRLMAAQMVADRALEAGAEPVSPDESKATPPAELEVVTFEGEAKESAPAEAKAPTTKIVVVGALAAFVGLLLVAVVRGARNGH